MRSRALATVTLFTTLALSGCHSAVIHATVQNHTGEAVSELEVDYPSASFGTSTLAPDAEYTYNFALIGNGPLKATWMDSAKKPHEAKGPAVQEGQRGNLTLVLQPDGSAIWSPELHR